MANQIALAEKYLPLLDEVYKRGSLTAVLDATSNKVKFVGGNKVEIFKTNVEGLGDYSRNSGFVTGDVNASWEPMVLTKDRGRSFQVDAMDDEETMGMAFGTLASEFLRTQVIPELDAYRLSKYASTPGATVVSGAVSSASKIKDLIFDAEEKMGDDEVPAEGRLLFVSEKVYKLLKGEITVVVQNGQNGYNYSIETFDGMRVIKVPKNRFMTGITLLDGKSSGQKAGGYTKKNGESYINFMIVHPSAVIQTVKHVVPRIFTPNENINADAYKFDYRVYHDAFTEENKVAGIYVHKDTTSFQ